jgi:hypothetical protein
LNCVSTIFKKPEKGVKASFSVRFGSLGIAVADTQIWAPPNLEIFTANPEDPAFSTQL